MLGNGRNVTQAVLRSQLADCANFGEVGKYRTEVTEEELGLAAENSSVKRAQSYGRSKDYFQTTNAVATPR
jgi:hypothetical protein